MSATTTAAPAPSTPLTPKARRAWAFLAAHEQRMAERYGGLREFFCGACSRLLFEYLPPVRMFVQRCRWCGSWQKLTTEPVTQQR